ncbi:MAG: GNAT family N-acetyltransferase [Kiloniellaceae bacterium]
MLIIRKLLAHELGALTDHLLRMDDDDRRLRFGHVVAPARVRAYVAAISWPQTWVVGAFEDGVLRGVAELRAGSVTGPRTSASGGARTAELSVTVERAWQDQGLGTRLLEKALLIARNRGFRTLFLLCLPENRKMQHIARKFGDRVSFEDGDVEVRIATPEPDPLTWFAEMADDAASLWQVALTWPVPATGCALPQPS